MGTTVIVLSLCVFFLAVLSVILWDENRRMNGIMLALNERLEQLIHRNHRETKEHTAQEIADKAKMRRAFRIKETWSEQRAKLEAQHDPEGEQHDKIVKELEKNGI